MTVVLSAPNRTSKLPNKPLERPGAIAYVDAIASAPAAERRVVGQTGTQLHAFEETVVLSVRADPEPGDLVIVQKTKGAVSQGHTNGVDRIAIVNPLELKAWVPSVLEEHPIRLPSGYPDLRRKLAIRRPEARRRARFHSVSGSSSVALPAARSARASAASLLRASCDAANWCAQSSSSPSSSRSHRAMRSCSSRAEAF